MIKFNGKEHIQFEGDAIIIHTPLQHTKIYDPMHDEFVEASVIGYRISHHEFTGISPINAVFTFGNVAVLVAPILVCKQEDGPIVERALARA